MEEGPEGLDHRRTALFPPVPCGAGNALGSVNTFSDVIRSWKSAKPNTKRPIASRFNAAMCDSPTFGFSMPFCMSRTGLHMAGPPRAFWTLAHDQHPYDALGQELRPGSGLRGPASLAHHPDQDRSRFPRQHDHPGAPRGYRGSKKTVPKPSTNPGVAGPPKFIGLPRVIAAQSPSDAPPAKITTRLRDASC